MTTHVNDLLSQIDNLRRKMIETGAKKGLSHPETVKCSEKLDKLIYKYQKGSFGFFFTAPWFVHALS